MPIRLLNQNPQYFKADGSAVLASGTLTFSASGTANLKDTYTDPTLGATNPNPVVLNASGQSSDIWLNGNYRVVLADALGNVQWTRDNVQGPADIPTQAGKTGQFLSTDGTTLEWETIVQVPDSTGNAQKILSTDGTRPYWKDEATSGIPALVAGAMLTNDGTNLLWQVASTNGFVIGGYRVQIGSGVAPIPTGSSLKYTSVDVDFPTVFSGTPKVWIEPNTISVSTDVYIPSHGVINLGIGSFSVDFHIDGSNGSINSTIPFSWLAIGPA